MKKLLSFLLAVLLISGFAVTAFAAAPEIGFDSSYDNETNTVAVALYVKNAVGTESADLSLAYDEAVFEYLGVEEKSAGSEVMIVADKTYEEGLCACSFMFAESCAESDLDENGDLQLAVFTFKPVSENFDINDFCLWATSYDIEGGVNILSQIKPQGDTAKQAEHNTNSVTFSANANNGNGGNASNSNSSGRKNSKWYVYVIAGALVITAIVGVSLIAVRSGNDEADSDAEESGSSDKSDKKQQ